MRPDGPDATLSTPDLAGPAPSRCVHLPCALLLALAACTSSAPQDADTDLVDTSDTDPADVDTDTDVVDTHTDVDSDHTDSDTPTGDTDPPVPACIVGTGELTLTPLSSGDEVPMHPGSQGRFHVWGAVRCTGIVSGGTSGSFALEDLSNPENPRVTWELYDAEDVLIGGYENLRRPMTRPTEVGMVGEEVIVWIGSYAENVGREVTMHFHLVDALGVDIESWIPLRLASDGTDTGAL